MDSHSFLFSPGRWIGSGKITFNGSPTLIRFYTSWQIEKGEAGQTHCVQQVEMQGVEEKVTNNFRVYEVAEGKFKISLQSESIENAAGVGIVDASTIAWEFHGDSGVEGFEVYNLQDNGDYMLHAEYASSDQFRTIIDARIWQKE